MWRVFDVGVLEGAGVVGVYVSGYMFFSMWVYMVHGVWVQCRSVRCSNRCAISGEPCRSSED